MLLAAEAGDIIQAGLVLQQGYIPGEHHTNLTQNSHFKQCILWWLGDLQPHPIYCMTIPLVEMMYIVCVCVCVRVCNIYVYIQYTYTSLQHIYL